MEAEILVHGPVEGAARQLMDHFWPGPLTLILPASSQVPGWILGSRNSIGIRVSPSAVCMSLLASLGRPLISTSANPAGSKPARSSAEAVGFFGDSVDLILDAGEIKTGTPSTVVDVTGSTPALLRRGGISLDAIRDVIGTIREAQGV